MKQGRDLTLEVLLTSENLAATDLLLEIVVHGSLEHRQSALEAVLACNRRDLLSTLVKEWHSLSEPQRERMLREGNLLEPAVRRAYADDDPQVYRNACEIIRDVPLYELAGMLLESLEGPADRKLNAIQLLEVLVVKFLEHKDRSAGTTASHRWDQEGRRLLAALHEGMKSFRSHKVESVAKLYLAIARGNPEETRRIHAIVDDLQHPCRSAILRTARVESDPLFIDWVWELLDSRTPAIEVIHTVQDRDDPAFVNALLERLETPLPPLVVHSLKKASESKWLTPNHPLLLSLDDRRLGLAARLASLIGIPLESKLAVISEVLQRGEVQARRSAAQTLALLPGTEANRLILRCLDDADVEVQIAVLAECRSRALPDAIGLLVRRLDHPDPRMQQAARNALADLSFERYLSSFEEMDDATRRKTGNVILKIDPDAMRTLDEHLSGRFRHHRIRACRTVRLLGLVDTFRPRLVALLTDEDAFIRREAIESLATTSDPAIVAELQQWMDATNRSALAREALEQLSRIAVHPLVRSAFQPTAQNLGTRSVTAGSPIGP